MAKEPAVAEGTEGDLVDQHLAPPKPDRTQQAFAAHQKAIDREKAANEALQKSLVSQQEMNEMLIAQNQKMADSQSALQDLAASSMAPRETEKPKEKSADFAATLSQFEDRMVAKMGEVMGPFAAKVTELAAGDDRRSFEGAKSSDFGSTFKLTEEQHGEIKAQMGNHPTLTYVQAAQLLSGQLAVVAKPKTETPAPTAPPVAAPAPVPVPAATPPSGQPAEKSRQHTPEETIAAALNAKDAGNKSDSEALFYKRLQEGTKDPHRQFGGHFGTQEQAATR